ncbi:MAG TPA: TonB-dependent receptor [Gammaproteobacteria bacterium]|nr:TonB-dependent receptor [Gammaproteobacteria bacterium]
MNSNLISKAVRYALVAGAASAVAAPSVFAADATTTNTSSDQSTAQLGKIEVTGTRIKRTTVETAQPITVVTAQEIKASGFASIGDVLQNLTSAGSALNSQVNNGNDGEENVDLRNLGAQRVLVLVNGKRWVTQINNTVDFYSIPASVIDHVEILQDGASAIYGSDAIAGVINVITVKDYNGAEANAYMGWYHGNGHTDGKKQEYDYTVGSSSDKSGVVMNVSYTDEAGIFAGDRTISKEAIYGVGGGSSAIPGGRFIINESIPDFNANVPNVCPVGSTLKPTFAKNSPGNPVIPGAPGPSTKCDVTLVNPGSVANPGRAAGAWHDFDFGRDAFNYAPLNYLLAPSERTSLYVQGHYDLADNLTFTTSVLFNNRRSLQQLAPEPLFLGEQAQGETNQGVNIGVAKDNPFNPFGVDLVPYPKFDATDPKNPIQGTFTPDPNFISWCKLYGSASCTTTGVELVSMRRRPIDPGAGNRVQDENVDTFHWNAGFKGYFNMLGNEWDWDVGGSYSSNVFNQSLTGDFDTANIQQALSESCPTTAGCVPLNLVGGAGPAGFTITPAMAAFIGFEAHNINRQDQRDYSANISGDLFDLPAGPLGLALGYEYLEQNGFFHPDALVSQGATTGNAAKPTDGRVATDAEYFEFNIPLVTDAPFMKDVSLDVADRFSQFKWGGVGPGQVFVPGADHASTARAALRWQATDDLLLRGAWSQGFRVPSISEFFSGVGNNFPAVTDPCTLGNAGGAFCASNGHPIVSKQSNGQINTLNGGNAHLTPEKSISKTVGFVYNPDWIPGYDLSVDYYDINLVNTVGTLGPTNILDGCYQSNVQPYCKLITVAAGSINQIVDTNTNTGSTITDGFDISTHYKFPSTSMGDFKLGFDLNLLKRFDETVPNATVPGGYAVSKLAGWSEGSPGVGASYPKKRATLNLAWHYGDWSAMWTLYYIDHTVEPCTNGQVSPTTVVAACTFNQSASNKALVGSSNLPSAGHGPARTWNPQGIGNSFLAQNYVGSTTYHDVEATYHMGSWNTDFTFGIQNLFGKQPPSGIDAFANTYYSFYNRIPGQFFYGRISVKF